MYFFLYFVRAVRETTGLDLAFKTLDMDVIDDPRLGGFQSPLMNINHYAIKTLHFRCQFPICVMGCVCRETSKHSRKATAKLEKSNMSTFNRFNHLVERFQVRRMQMRTDRHFKSGNPTLESGVLAWRGV